MILSVVSDRIGYLSWRTYRGRHGSHLQEKLRLLEYWCLHEYATMTSLSLIRSFVCGYSVLIMLDFRESTVFVELCDHAILCEPALELSISSCFFYSNLFVRTTLLGNIQVFTANCYARTTPSKSQCNCLSHLFW